MKLLIDNLDGLGALDYSGAVEPGTLEIVRVLNKPSTFAARVCLLDSGLVEPVRRGRVAVESAAGTMLFSGYLTIEPVAVYAGVASVGAVYRLELRGVSEEWLLDKAGVLSRAGLAIGVTGGAAAGALAGRLVTGAAGLKTSTTGGRQLGVFQVPAASTWSTGAGAAAGAAYSAYRVLNGAMSVGTAGAATHTFADGDGSLVVAGARTASTRELANDVTVTGEMEPAAYWMELFEGDGTTAIFSLTGQPEAVNAGKADLLSDDFSQPLLNRQVWSVADPGSHIGLSGSGLTLAGGNGLDGQTTLTALDPVEMGGTLIVELDQVQMTAGSAGVIGGLYNGPVTQVNCFAGFGIGQAGGNTVLTPMLNGASVGTAYTLVSGHVYSLRLRLHCPEMIRVRQSFYAMTDVAGAGPQVTLFGGGLVSAAMNVVFELRDLGFSSNTPAIVLYDGSVTSSPATCTLAAVNSLQMFGSVGQVVLRRTGSAWVRTNTGTTLLVGAAGEGLACTLTGTASAGAATFYAGQVPAANALFQVSYRGRRRSVARMMDAASIAEESAGGGNGTERWLGKVVSPKARSTEDCENAGLAVLSFAADRAAAVAGTCTAVNPSGGGTQGGDIWPGDLLAFPANGSGVSVLVRKATLTDGGCVPERITYRMEFANDWAEGLGIGLTDAVATDALLPVVAIDSTLPETSRVLSNLPQLVCFGPAGTGASFCLQVDAGTAPPAGGGFEVRRRDSGFGLGITPQTAGDLVLRSPVRGFQIPVASVGERFFIRMYDANTPPRYSRESSVLVTHLPVG